MNIETALERFIVEELMLGDDQTKVGHDDSLISSGVLDSLALLRLIAFVEEQFGVTVEDGEVVPENFETINVTKAFVEQKL